MEYDSDRAGDFTPLRHWSNKESKVVLGLVTSKFPDLEDTEKIKERIKEAQQFVPLENLSISPQCGFASTEEGNHLTEEEQWKKIQLLRQVAKKFGYKNVRFGKKKRPKKSAFHGVEKSTLFYLPFILFIC